MASALRSAAGGSSRDYVAFSPNAGGKQTRLGFDPESGTARALTISTPQGVVSSHGVRRLTPRECERLQGFPDDYTLIPWRKAMAPDGPRYRVVGDSMAVPVMRWIGERIALADALPALELAA